ncbi:MAG: cation transporter [Bdellovibrionales bacterium]|nr:cation transporter [Bdellovibrionales bacterium]
MYSSQSEQIQKISERAMNVSVFVSVLMLVGKCTAYVLTGSTAILSDAAESIVHIVATGFSAFSLRYANRPADREHPYGHDKIVAFSIGSEGALIFVAALFIVLEAIEQLIVGPQIKQLSLGMGITAFLAGVNLLLGFYLLRLGKKYDAPVLTANGQHVLTDMWTSIAVLFGVLVVWVTDIIWLDPVVALLAAGYIFLTGYRLMHRAVGQVMDSAKEEVTREIQRVLSDAMEENLILRYHQLRHREAHRAIWIEVHLLFQEDLSLREAHRRATEVERRIEACFPNRRTQVTSHLEPENHAEIHPAGHSIVDPLSPLKEQGRSSGEPSSS